MTRAEDVGIGAGGKFAAAAATLAFEAVTSSW